MTILVEEVNRSTQNKLNFIIMHHILKRYWRCGSDIMRHCNWNVSHPMFQSSLIREIYIENKIARIRRNIWFRRHDAIANIHSTPTVDNKNWKEDERNKEGNKNKENKILKVHNKIRMNVNYYYCNIINETILATARIFNKFDLLSCNHFWSNNKYIYIYRCGNKSVRRLQNRDYVKWRRLLTATKHPRYDVTLNTANPFGARKSAAAKRPRIKKKQKNVKTRAPTWYFVL